MKIINAIHAQAIGGVDQVFRDYAEILVQQGHQVSFLISDNGKDNYSNLGVREVFKLKNSAQIFDFLRVLWILIICRPDLMICHSRRLMNWSAKLKFFRLTKIIKTKTIAVNHGIHFDKSLCCDYVISINDDISRMVVAAGFNKNKVFTLPNAIKINEKYREKTLHNPPLIGIYGRIEARKGFDILIKACGILKKQGQEFRLKIGGFETGGDDWGWKNIDQWIAEENIGEECYKVGTVVNKKDFFTDIDIFCVPSREEPFGIVILEGFLHSTLVISSDTIGGKLLIKDDENGVIFTNENCQELAAKISEILKNPDSYNIKTKNAFLRLEKEFSLNSLSDKMSAILTKISTKNG